MIEKQINFLAGKTSGKVSAIFLVPEKARWLLVLAHGAAAGMTHPFMSGLSRQLADEGMATFRYQFPYMEAGKKSPDPQSVLVETVCSAVAAAREYGKGLHLLAGGKSLGGRMTSTAASQEALSGVKGLVFFGFPLHAPGKPSSERADHLFKIRLPMLFLQGTRDSLAEFSLIDQLSKKLQRQGHATLRVIEGADHGFHVPKKSGGTDQGVLVKIGEAVSEWADELDLSLK
jgi:uncharacterized protein